MLCTPCVCLGACRVYWDVPIREWLSDSGAMLADACTGGLVGPLITLTSWLSVAARVSTSEDSPAGARRGALRTVRSCWTSAPASAPFGCCCCCSSCCLSLMAAGVSRCSGVRLRTCCGADDACGTCDAWHDNVERWRRRRPPPPRVALMVSAACCLILTI